MVKVSIITPTYNRAHFIGRCIDSVLMQTVSDWELIVIDDGSVDNTEEIVSSYVSRDARIKYFKIENGGPGNARNVGFDKSSGQYITYLDSDDEYFPNKIAAQLELFQTSPVPNLGVVSCGKKNYRDDVFESQWVPSLRGNILDELLRKKITVGATTSFLMVKREVYATGARWSLIPSANDFDFLVQVCMKYNFDHVPLPLVKMNHHSGPRVFTDAGASKSYDILYSKYQDIITKKPKVHQGFLDKYIFMKYRNGDFAEAKRILQKHYPRKTLSRYLWKLVLSGKNDARSLRFRVIYRLIKRL